MKRTRTSRTAHNCRLRAGGSMEEGHFSVNLGEIGREQAVISTPHALNRRALQGNPLTEPNTPWWHVLCSSYAHARALTFRRLWPDADTRAHYRAPRRELGRTADVAHGPSPSRRRRRFATQRAASKIHQFDQGRPASRRERQISFWAGPKGRLSAV